jgi:hypothetical protein
MPHFSAIFLQRLSEHLALRRLPCAIEAFEDYEFTPRHIRYG